MRAGPRLAKISGCSIHLRRPPMIPRRTVLAATLISSLVVRRRIDRLDLVAVLKSRD